MNVAFRQQKGVVLTQVCGEYLLVATREAFGKCPYVNRIGSAEVDYWMLMSEGKSPREMVIFFVDKYNISYKEAIRILDYATEKFVKHGYLVEEIVEES